MKIRIDYLQVIDKIGRSCISSVLSDSTGNTKLARSLIVDEIPHILNLPDPEHHLNNTWKEIAGLEFFDKVSFP